MDGRKRHKPITGLTPTIVFNQAFDAASNRTELRATIGGSADFKNTYAYDNLNRMTQVIQQSQSGGNAVAPKRIDFAYNAAGQFTQLDRYQSTGTSNDVAQTFFTFDGMGRLASMDHKQGSTVLAGYDYTYDAASRITSIDSTVEGLSQFTYDVTNQLTAADHTSQPDENYSFDLNGSRTGTGVTVGDNNRTTSDGTYNYEYDNEGNRTKRTKISDGSYEEYQWDHRNRLTNVTFKNSDGTVQKTVEHSYDVFNRWVRKTTDPDGAGSSPATNQFFAYDGYNPVLQFDGSAASDLSNRNLFGPEVDQILAIEDVTSLSQAGNTVWGLGDHLGTPRDVADLNEGSGLTSVTNHRTYNSFGKRISESNSSVDFQPGFTGKLYDEDTATGNHINRLYDAALLQWLSEDPQSFVAGDANLRRYVHNSPTVFIDPDGLAGQPSIGPDKRTWGERMWDYWVEEPAKRVWNGHHPVDDPRKEEKINGRDVSHSNGRMDQWILGNFYHRAGVPLARAARGLLESPGRLCEKGDQYLKDPLGEAQRDLGRIKQAEEKWGAMSQVEREDAALQAGIEIALGAKIGKGFGPKGKAPGKSASTGATGAKPVVGEKPAVPAPKQPSPPPETGRPTPPPVEPRTPIPGDADFVGPHPKSWTLAPAGEGAHMVEKAGVAGREGLAAFDTPGTPRFYPSGTPENAGAAHIRLHKATRDAGIALRKEANSRLSDAELLEQYRRAYNDPCLDGIRGDLRTPDGSTVIASGVTPSEAFEALLEWFKKLPKGE